MWVYLFSYGTIGWVGGTAAGLTGILLLILFIMLYNTDTTWSSFVEVVHWTRDTSAINVDDTV